MILIHYHNQLNNFHRIIHAHEQLNCVVAALLAIAKHIMVVHQQIYTVALKASLFKPHGECIRCTKHSILHIFISLSLRKPYRFNQCPRNYFKSMLFLHFSHPFNKSHVHLSLYAAFIAFLSKQHAKSLEASAFALHR